MLARKIAVILALASSAGSAQADLVISNGATSNVQCAAGTCTAMAANAVLNATELAGMLAGGDVAVKTANGAASIAVTAPLSWTSASRLTLDASDGIGIRAPVVVAGDGAMTVTTNDGGSGDLNFPGEGRIEFWDTSSGLIINGHAYTLVNAIAGLAQAVKANQSGFYALAKSYDAAPDGLYSKSPVDKPPFKGTFEGLGNAISNLSIHHHSGIKVQLSNTGLFSTSSGMLRDIDMLNVHIYEGSDRQANVGALVGLNSGTILQATATGTVNFAGGSGGGAGGLAGRSKGTILRSHADIVLDESLHSASGGGLVGINDAGGLISQSYSTGSVIGSLVFPSTAGGLVGATLPGSTITLSHSSAAVSASFAAGGLVAVQSGTITQSFADGTVTGTGEAGGLVGLNNGPVANVYSVAPVTGEPSVGGAIGGLMGSHSDHDGGAGVTAAYVAAPLSHQSSILFGAIVGDVTLPSSFANVYWDKEATGVSDPSKAAGDAQNLAGVKMLKDKQLKAKLPAGFDPAIWGQKKAINNGLPYLLANPPGQ